MVLLLCTYLIPEGGEMSDQYFKDKAEEVFQKIKVNEGWGADSIFNLDDPTCKLIYMSLKEVARDQRYACIDAVKNYPHTDAVSSLQGLIQNASIPYIEKELPPLKPEDDVIIIKTGKEATVEFLDTDGKYKVSFDSSWQGWYKREELMLKG